MHSLLKQVCAPFWVCGTETFNINIIDCIYDLCLHATSGGATACQRAFEVDHKQLSIGSALKNEQWTLEGV